MTLTVNEYELVPTTPFLEADRRSCGEGSRWVPTSGVMTSRHGVDPDPCEKTGKKCLLLTRVCFGLEKIFERCFRMVNQRDRRSLAFERCRRHEGICHGLQEEDAHDRYRGPHNELLAFVTPRIRRRE